MYKGRKLILKLWFMIMIKERRSKNKLINKNKHKKIVVGHV
jgi:hypothetical protein